MKQKEINVYFLKEKINTQLKKSYFTALSLKITAVIVFLFSVQVTAGIVAENIKLNVKDQKLELVLNEIKKQSGYSFLINSSHLKKSNLVTIKVSNISIESLLNEIFKEQPFNYIISDNIVTISPKAIVTGIGNLQQQISGRVVNERGGAMNGVTVVDVSTSKTVHTDEDGKFSIVVSGSAPRLKFNFLGYISVERTASANMNVVMREDDTNIEEVVVTGFQKIDKTKFTGSVSHVDKKNIDRSGAIDVSRMLQGAAAGVSVQNTSGTFGATPKIRIRGNSSISANQEPLYVINGVPITSPSNVAVSQLYSGDPSSVLSSAIAGLNAQDIEDIQILKDGAATALYGTRAANGVISITTKRGQYNSRNISFSSAWSVGIKPSVKQFNLMNSNQEIQLYKEMYDRGYLSNANWPNSTGAFTETYKQLALRELTLEQSYEELNRSANANTDWFDILFRNNLIQENSLAFSGGGEKNTYYTSGSYAKDNGQAIGFGMDRFTTDVRTVLNITPKLNLDVNLNWNYRSQQTPGTYNSGTTNSEVTRSFEINPFLYAMRTSRAMYPYNPDGSLKYYTENLAPFNIIKELNENFNQIRAQEVRVNIRPTFKILDNLTYDGTFAIRKSNNSYNHTVTELSNVANAYRVDYNDVLRAHNSLLYRDPNDPFGYRQTILPEGGFLFSRNNWQSFWNIRNQITFTDTFDKHRVSVLVGNEVEEIYVDREYSKGTGYLYYGGKIISPSRLAMIRAVNEDDRTFISSFQRKRSVGFYSNIQYSFNDKYNLDLTGRLDGSNIFGRATRSKFLPNYSVGFAWNADREDFFQTWSFSENVDFLKLRASYALRGNSFEISPMLDASYVNLTRLDAVNNDRGISITSPELFNLNWEKDYITNFGFDLGLYKRFNFAFEFYTRKNTDLVIPFNISQEEGFTSKRINLGDMSNKGFDVTLGFRNILNKQDFHWDINLIYGYVKNKLLNGELQSSQLTQITRSTGYPIEGYPLEGLFGFRFAGLGNDGQPRFYDENNVAVNGLVSSVRNRGLIEYMGSRQPLGTGSMANSFIYKGFELRVFLTYAYGHKVFTQPVAARNYNDSGSKSGDLNYRWQTIGDENYTNIPGLISTIQRTYLNTISNIDEVAYNRSDFRVADASHLRINEILLSYDIGKLLNKSIPAIKNGRIMFSANNIHYWASGRLRGVDPELYITGGTAMPNPRTYTMRLTLGF